MICLCTSKLFPAAQAFKQAVIQTIKQIEDILTKKKYIYIRVHPRLQFRVFLGFLKKKYITNCFSGKEIGFNNMRRKKLIKNTIV
jgi:hypothetical protein